MKKFEIVQTTSGVILGIYEGETAEQALDAMAQDAGYSTYEESLAVTGETREDDTLVVTEINPDPRA